MTFLQGEGIKQNNCFFQNVEAKDHFCAAEAAFLATQQRIAIT